MLFDREKRAMSMECAKKMKVKKNKALYTKLAMLDDSRRNPVLKSYFSACKMAFRIKATVNYTWSLNKNLEDIFELFQNDSTFHKMQALMKHDLINAFGSTSPNELVIGEISA